MSRQNFDINGGYTQAVGYLENSTFIQNITVQDGQRRDRCLNYFAVTDPRDVKTNIHDTRGTPLKESYDWILRHSQFQSWRDGNENQVLWIKGDPGKGKTMLLCGIIDELRPTTKLADPKAETLLSFFFCQATVPKLSNAHAVLRGLIYMLVDTQPSFLPHIRKRFTDTGEPRFGDAEAWAALCNMLLEVLLDTSQDKIYIVVDALDECVQDRDKLLQFVLQGTRELSQVKWVISSRNHVGQREGLLDSQSVLSLELQDNAESVSMAINAYISERISRIHTLQDNPDREYVQRVLCKKAEGTFLWVALVVQELQSVKGWKVRQIVDDVPKGLDDLYARMIDQLYQLASNNREHCQLVLSAATLAYRPLLLLELGVVSGLPDTINKNVGWVKDIVKESGSFLTVNGDTVSFVHQSAKEYLIAKTGVTIFPSGPAAAHRRMFMKSLQAMKRILRRDIYGLRALGTAIDQAKQPNPDPLAAIGYSCIYWVNHLEDSGRVETLLHVLCLYPLQLGRLLWGLFGGSLFVTKLGALLQEPPFSLDWELQDEGTVDVFIRERYLCWLEALSLLQRMTEGILAVQKLELLLQGRSKATELRAVVKDAHRFILYHRGAIENNPLQIYSAALVFSPARSMIKELFWQERPKDITIMPAMENDWDAHTGACLQTLEGHDHYVNSVVFSLDSRRVASGSSDKTIKIWDAQTGACLQTLEAHDDWVKSVVFSPDSKRVASGSWDKTMKIWDAQTGACLQTLEGHDHYVNSVVFSLDSRRVASGSSDKTIKIWDAQTGACLQTLEGHDDGVRSVVFSPDSRRIASGSSDKTIKIWDVQTGSCLQTLDGHDHGVRSVAFSPDSKRVASGSRDKTIKIWNAQTGACLQTLEGHNRDISSVVFSPNSHRVVSGSWDKTIKIWDMQTGVCLQTLLGHDEYINSVVFSHDSRRIASGSRDQTMKIWDAQTGACLQTLESHNGNITSVVFSPDGSRVTSGSWDKTIKIWDTQTGACLQTLEGHDDGVRSVVISHDSRRVASGSDDKTIKIWDAQTGACLQTLAGHNEYISSVVFSLDSRRVASGSSDKTIKIWDAQTGACLQTLAGHNGYINSVVFSPDSRRVASGSSDKTIKIWDAQTGACLQTLEGHYDGVRSVVFSPDSKRVASGSWDKTVKIWHTQTGACLQTLESHNGEISSVVFFLDSRYVASGSWDKTIKIWDAQIGACLQTLEGHSDWVRSVVFSPDNKHVASGSRDKTIKIWDAQTGACLQTLEGHNRDISSVVFSHDGSRVASGSFDKSVKIWDMHTGACLQTLEGDDRDVNSVVFSPDSSRIASGSDDKTIKIWDAQTGTCLQTLEGHNRDISSVVFSHDGSRVASGSFDKSVKIWDTQTGVCLQTLEGHDDWVKSVVFSPDSKHVASGSRDKTIKIWDAQTGTCLQKLEGHNRDISSVVFSHDGSRVASGSFDKSVKIWDTHSGACLQTLGVGSFANILSFDTTNSSLHTDVGVVALRYSLTPTPTTPIEVPALALKSPSPSQPPQKPVHQGYGISSDRLWITWRSQNWLWLPPTYRLACSAVARSGLTVVLGCRSGRVLILGFVPQDAD